MGKNINSLQLYRNTSTLYESKAAAISGITGTATNDGTIKLARYKDGDKIRTIFGIYSKKDEISGSTGITADSYTIYDSPQEVIAALEGRVTANETAIAANKTAIDTNKAAIDTLNGANTESGSVANSIKTAIEGLNATIDSTGGSFVDVKVVEAAGKITTVTVSENNIASADLLGKTTDTADKDTAFGYIAKEAANRASAITAAINDLDVTEVGGTGKVITTISETDGKISAAAIDLVASAVSATAISASTGSVAVEGTTVAAQIASLATSIKSVSGDAKSYSIASISGTELDKLGTNVKEAYKLVDEDGNKAGEYIKIYKDSSLESVALSGQTLNFTYILADGSKSTVGVDVSTFLAESEFSDGLQVVDHVVSVKKDATSEGFLTVSADGVKVSGVQNAIDTAAKKAATEVVEDAAGHVTVTKAQGANGQAVYTIGENDIASANLLGTTGSTSGETSAFGYIAKEVAERKAAIEGLNATIDSTGGTFVDVQVVETAGKITAVTVSENDIASASGTNNAITAETQARTDEDAKIVAGVGFSTGGTYLIAANTGTGASVSAASTVKDAIYTLDNALAAAKKANALTAADNTVVVDSNNGNGTKVKVNIATATTVTNFVGYAADGSFIKSDMFGTIDAGTY